MEPSGLCLILKIHLEPTMRILSVLRTRVQVLFCMRAWNSDFIALYHTGVARASLTVLGRHVWREKAVKGTLGLTIPLLPLVTMGCILSTVFVHLVASDSESKLGYASIYLVDESKVELFSGEKYCGDSGASIYLEDVSLLDGWELIASVVSRVDEPWDPTRKSGLRGHGLDGSAAEETEIGLLSLFE